MLTSDVSQTMAGMHSLAEGAMRPIDISNKVSSFLYEIAHGFFFAAGMPKFHNFQHD